MLAAMVVDILNSGMINIPMTLHIMELTAVVTQMFCGLAGVAAELSFAFTQKMFEESLLPFVHVIGLRHVEQFGQVGMTMPSTMIFSSELFS